MFNSAPFNTQTHNGGTPGVRFIGYAETRQIVLGLYLFDVACRQIIWNEAPGDIVVVQTIYAVLRDETHVIQV